MKNSKRYILIQAYLNWLLLDLAEYFGLLLFPNRVQWQTLRKSSKVAYIALKSVLERTKEEQRKAICGLGSRFGNE